MTRWLSTVVFLTWTSIFGTEQLVAPEDYGSRLAISRPIFLSPQASLRKLIIRVLNFEDRIVRDAVVWEGTNVTLSCKARGFSKGTRLSWTEPSGNATLRNENRLKIEKVFNRVTQSNSGLYICNANDTERGNYLSKSVFLRVEAAPIIRTNNVTALEGSRAVLRCTIGNQLHTFSWLFEGKELQSDVTTEISHRKLVFHKVNRRHSGRYECRVTLGQLKISAYPVFSVVYPPEILEGPRNVTAEIGDTVTFQCNVTGHPELAVTWKLYEMAINTSNSSTTHGKYNQSRKRGLHVLTITDVQQEENGRRYSCCVGNGNGNLLIQSAYLRIQGPPSPPKVNVEAIYGKGSAVFAAINWTRPDYDGNSPIISYELGCKRKGREKFLAVQVDSDVFSAEVRCAFINQPNQLVPYLLHLLLRVTVSNTLSSTSSDLLDLTVEVHATESNQSAFEVFMTPPTRPLTMTTTTSTKQTYPSAMSLNSYKDAEKENASSAFSTSDGASSSGDSDNSTSETWPLFAKSGSPVASKALSTSFQPTVQFFPKAASNETNFEDGSGLTRGSGLAYIVVGSLVALIFASVAVVGVTAYVRKRYRSEQISSQRQHLDSFIACTEESFQVSCCSTETCMYLGSPTACTEDSIERPATEPCIHLKFPTTFADEAFQAADELSESLNGSLNRSFHRDHDNSLSNLVSIYTSTSMVESTVHPVLLSLEAAEQLSESSDVFCNFGHDHSSGSTILVENTAHLFSTSLLEMFHPNGGVFDSGSFFLCVPQGAVKREEQFRCQFLYGTEPIPTIEISKEWFAFSPILVLEPHDYHFQVPVRVRFPFTATLEGWILVLSREEPQRGWKTVLTLDTNTRQVISRDPHCNYNVNSRLLLLDHFCKYRWCGYRKRNAIRSGKILACLLMARMDRSGNSCNFALHLTDNCFDIFQEVKKIERESFGSSFGLKDLGRIQIGTSGELKIEFRAVGFELENEDSITLAIEDLWPMYGCQKRVLFRGRCVERVDGSQDLELRITLSASDQRETMLAIFPKRERFSVSHQRYSISSLTDGETIAGSVSDSLYHTGSESSPIQSRDLRCPAASESSPGTARSFGQGGKKCPNRFSQTGVLHNKLYTEWLSISEEEIMKVAMQTTDGQQGRKWQAVGTENFVGFENREEEAYSYSSTCDQEVTSYSALSTQSFPLEYQADSKCDPLLPSGSEAQPTHGYKEDDTYCTSSISTCDQEATSPSIDLPVQNLPLEHKIESKSDHRSMPIGAEIQSTHGFTYMTPVQDLISDPPVQCIVEVANLLDLEDEKGGDWPRLWQELMHKFPNEAVVRHNKRGPTIFLLKTWCQIKLPSVATVGELVNALKAVNRADVALIIEKYCEPERHCSPLLVNSCQWKMEVDEEGQIQLHFGKDKRVQLLKTSCERQVVGRQGHLLGSVSSKWIFCIPPGALDYEQEITVSFYHVTDSVGLDNNESVTGIIEVTPHELKFSKSVELLLRHDLCVEKPSSKATVLYYSGEIDCETVPLCQLSSTDDQVLTNDINTTLWDDFIHIETPHVCRFGVHCKGDSCIEVWASLFAPEYPHPEHFRVRLSLTSQAPKADDEDVRSMMTYGLVRNTQLVLTLSCYQQENLQINVKISSKAEGWTVNDDSEFSQTIEYSVIKDMVFYGRLRTTEFWFSKERSLVDVTEFAPFFEFNSCCCILNPPASAMISGSRALSGPIVFSSGVNSTSVRDFSIPKGPCGVQDGTLSHSELDQTTESDTHHHNEDTGHSSDDSSGVILSGESVPSLSLTGQSHDDVRNCASSFEFRDNFGHWNLSSNCSKSSKSSNELPDEASCSTAATDCCGENDGYFEQSNDIAGSVSLPQPEESQGDADGIGVEDSGRSSAGSIGTRHRAISANSETCSSVFPENDQHDCHDLDRPITRTDIEYISGSEHITQNWLQMGWLMLKCTIRHLKNNIMKDYLKFSNSAKVIYLIELWQETESDKATAKALVDICCNKTVGGVRSIIENSLKYGPDSHSDNSKPVNSAATPDHDPDRVIRAVVKLGCDAWLSVGLELGFYLPEITAATASPPSPYDKLRAIIELKIMKIGREATAQKLLEVCKVLPTPIHEKVMDELKRNMLI